MPSGACEAWLQTAGAFVGILKTAFLATGLFVAAILITLVLQHRRLLSYQSEINTTWNADPQAWTLLRLVYEEFPEQYVDDDLAPWYRFLAQTTLLSTLLSGDQAALEKDPSKGAKTLASLIRAVGPDRPNATMISNMSAAFKSLRDYDVAIRTVFWAVNARVNFDDLKRDELSALVSAYGYSFDLKMRDGERDAKAFAQTFFEKHLDAQKNELGDLSFTRDFVAAMKIGMTLDNLAPLKGALSIQDLATFGDLDTAHINALRTALADTKFTSLHLLQQKEEELKRKIQAIQSRDADSPVKIPFVDMDLTLSDFGYISSALNVGLLLWIFWAVIRLRASFANVRLSDPAGYDPGVAGAAFALLPGAVRWPALNVALLTIFLASPTLAGVTVLPWSPAGLRGMSMFVALAAVVVLVAFGVASTFQKVKSEALKRSAT